MDDNDKCQSILCDEGEIPEVWMEYADVLLSNHDSTGDAGM